MGRIVAVKGFDRIDQKARITVFTKLNHRVSNRVVRYRIQLPASEIAFTLVISDFIGSVLPNLADDDRITLFGFNRLRDSFEEASL